MPCAFEVDDLEWDRNPLDVWGVTRPCFRPFFAAPDLPDEDREGGRDDGFEEARESLVSEFRRDEGNTDFFSLTFGVSLVSLWAVVAVNAEESSMDKEALIASWISNSSSAVSCWRLNFGWLAARRGRFVLMNVLVPLAYLQALYYSRIALSVTCFS